MLNKQGKHLLSASEPLVESSNEFNTWQLRQNDSKDKEEFQKKENIKGPSLGNNSEINGIVFLIFP